MEPLSPLIDVSILSRDVDLKAKNKRRACLNTLGNKNINVLITFKISIFFFDLPNVYFFIYISNAFTPIVIIIIMLMIMMKMMMMMMMIIPIIYVIFKVLLY